MTQIQYANNKRLIIGLGMTGLSAARYCIQQGWPVDLCDTRAQLPQADEIRREFPHSRLTLGPLLADDLRHYQQLIVSPGVALSEPAIVQAMAHGVDVVGDVQLFADVVTAPIVAITGSNGKSTVTTLTAEILKSAGLRVGMGGNIGIPVLDLLAQGEMDVYVLELSSFQLETTPRLSAHSATILNISADHLDRYADMTDYVHAKQRIFQDCQRVVLNRDDPVSWPFDLSMSTVGFTTESSQQDFALVQTDGVDAVTRDGHIVLRSDELRMKGRHNLANVMAALALAQPWLTDWKAAVHTVKVFAGLPHRCQWVASVQGVDCYNDSKGTNVGSTMAAIAGLHPSTRGRMWLFLGGVAKGQDFSQLGELCEQLGIRVCVYGQDRAALTEQLSRSVIMAVVNTLSEAFAVATNAARDGDVLLFSPACASFDQFDHYEARGEYFVSLVTAWQSGCRP